mgnify:FL=1
MTLGAISPSINQEFTLACVEAGQVDVSLSLTHSKRLIDGILPKVTDLGYELSHGGYVLTLSGGSGPDIPFDVGKASVGTKNGARTFKDRFDSSWRDKISSVLVKMVEYLESKGIHHKRRVKLWLLHIPPQSTKIRDEYITDLENVLLQRMAHHANPNFYYSQRNVRNSTRQICHPLYRVRGVRNLRGSRSDCYTGSPGGRLSANEIELGEAFSRAFRW